MIGVATYKTNEHDSKTLETALVSANGNRTKLIEEAICEEVIEARRR